MSKSSVLKGIKLKSLPRKKKIDIASWGPESALAKKTLSKTFVNRVLPHLLPLLAVNTLPGTLSLRNAYLNGGIGGILKSSIMDTWESSEKKLKAIYLMASKRALDKTEKAIRASDYSLSDSLEHSKKTITILLSQETSFLNTYTDTLIDKFKEFDIAKNTITKEQFIITSTAIALHYMTSLTDIGIGISWNSAIIDYAHGNSISEYMIIAQMDDTVNPPCEECQELHETTFFVEGAYKNTHGLLDAATMEDMKKYHPFPTMDSIENTDNIESSGLCPPFHDLCRCEVILVS